MLCVSVSVVNVVNVSVVNVMSVNTYSTVCRDCVCTEKCYMGGGVKITLLCRSELCLAFTLFITSENI